MDRRIQRNNSSLQGWPVIVGILTLVFCASVSAQVTQLPTSVDGTNVGAASITDGILPASVPIDPSSSNSTSTSHLDTNTSSSISNVTRAPSAPTTEAISNSTSLPLTTIVENATGPINESYSSPLSSPASISNSTSSSPREETDMAASLTTLVDMTDDTGGVMTTTMGDLVTYELLTEDFTSGFGDENLPDDDGGIFSESFLRLLIIAGATAGSCIVLLTVVFIIVLCYHRRQRRRRNARYYEFKKKNSQLNFKSKYERVELQNSLARRDQPENTPIGGGWVFSSGGYHHDYDDDDTPTTAGGVALRAISPIAVATPLLKVPSVATASTTLDDLPNGVPDSGHGGSIPPDDSAFGFSPSLEEDIELELSPLYRALGTTSAGTGSEARDHSYIGGDSDAISDGNEPVVDDPIRDVHFDSFGGRGKPAREEPVEL